MAVNWVGCAGSPDFCIVDLRLEAITLAAVYSVSGILDAMIRIVVGCPRPSAGLVEGLSTLNDQSFPSGHVTSYVAFWGMLFTFGMILFDGPHRWWRIGLLVISAFFVVLIGPSRIYLGAHWATDVLGAYLIEVALLGIALLVYLQLNKRGVLARCAKNIAGSHREKLRGARDIVQRNRDRAAIAKLATTWQNGRVVLSE